jgi:cullin-associated NEDD8-dissociated protein 1
VIVRAVHRQMREKSIKTRQDCLTLLRELVVVLPGALAQHVPALIPGILYSLGYAMDHGHILLYQ